MASPPVIDKHAAMAAALIAAELLMTKYGCSATFTRALFDKSVVEGVSRTNLDRKFGTTAKTAKAKTQKRDHAQAHKQAQEQKQAAV